jgi:hypothetical protein
MGYERVCQVLESSPSTYSFRLPPAQVSRPGGARMAAQLAAERDTVLKREADRAAWPGHWVS